MRAWCAAVAVAAVALLGACGNDEGSESAESTPSAADGKAVFAKAGCGTCHSLADAGATGTVGVDFDETKPSALKVRTFVTNGSPPRMPAFKGTLTDAEIAAVAEYVQEATGAEPVEE